MAHALAAPAPISRKQIFVVFSGLVLGVLLAALDSTIVSTALPTIVGELGGLAHLSWVVTAYLLAQTIVTPLYGKLGDLYGRKGVLQAAIVIFLVFLVAAGIAVVGCVLSWLLPERPLRETVAAESASNIVGEVGEAFAMPSDADSDSHVLRGLTALASRDVGREHIVQICERAGVDLSPAAAWPLIRLAEQPTLDPDALGRTRNVEVSRMRDAAAQLRERGLIAERVTGGGLHRELTAAGADVLSKLVTARRARLAELFADWAPGARDELAAVLRSMARELVPEAPSRGAVDLSRPARAEG